MSGAPLPAHCMDKYLLSSCSLYGRISALALFLHTVRRNPCSHLAHGMGELCSHPAHCMEESLLSSCSLNGDILLSSCLLSEECLLSSCSLNGEIPALIQLTVWRNVCSLPAHLMDKYLLSSSLLYGGMTAFFLLTAWRNTCSQNLLTA